MPTATATPATRATASADDPFEALRARVAAAVTLPGEPGWDTARQAWNLAADQHPAVVTEPTTAAEVVTLVEFARDHELRVAVQSTGHAASALGSLSHAMLVRTHLMRAVTIDAAARRARVEAGARWADVVLPASAHGLAALAGSSPDVGVAGYALSGGIGWLARSHGLAADSIVAIEMVTADGRLLRIDRDHTPDLFWAVRGGGGSFGVVTGIELELFPIERLYAGALFFPWERSTEVLGAWREWVRNVPDETTSVGRILQFPPLEEIPAPLRGRAFVIVEAAHLGDETEGEALLAPLRALGPELDTFAMVAPADLLALHMDPPGPTPVEGDGALLDGLPSAAIEALVAVAGPASGSTLQTVELRHLGGALARAPAHAGALGSVGGEFLLFAGGIAPDADAVRRTATRVDAIKAALSPWDAGHRYLNFAERPIDARAGFPAATHRRLREVKTRHDPADLFLAKHPIEPAARASR
jgi:FAD/FMN-containing dehydrogenase